MIGFDCIKVAANFNHAVPGSVRLKVIRLGILDWISLLKGAEIGNQAPGPVGVHTNDAVGNGPAHRASNQLPQAAHRVCCQ